MECMMNSLSIAITAAFLLGLPIVAAAQTKVGPGQSEYAPGQRAKQPGQAKKYAPGQRMHKYDNPKYPGASEYAPGRQPKKKTNPSRGG
jgi:hypothetical protein